MASYFAFDRRQLTGKDIRGEPIEDRRAELERIAKGADAILLSEAIAAEGDASCSSFWAPSAYSDDLPRLAVRLWPNRALVLGVTRNPLNRVGRAAGTKKA